MPAVVQNLKDLEIEADLASMTLDMTLKEMNDFDPDTVAKPTLRRTYKTLVVIHDKLINTIGKMNPLCKTPEEFEAYRLKFETRLKLCNAAQDDTEILMEKLYPTVAPTVVTSSSAKLEPLKIPTFSGNYDEWQSFHDMFQSMVDKRTNLSGAEKLTYLKAALKDSASSIISSYESTDANYIEAWAHLKSRFEVKREILFAHIKTFEDVKLRHGDPDSGLRSLSDSLSKFVRSLSVQGVNVDEWDVIIVYMALKKLDPDSRKQWSLAQKNDLPKVKDFKEFVENRARALTAATPGKVHNSSTGHSSKAASHHVAKAKSKSNSLSTPKSACIKCSGPHNLYKCSDFQSLTVQQRISFAKQQQLCLNCLRPNHSQASCTNTFNCFKCGLKHHTALHYDKAPTSPAAGQNPSSHHCVVSSNAPEKVVLLGTLIVNVKDAWGRMQECRVFVDNGSETHFISEHCLSRLGLKKGKLLVPLNTIGNRSGPVFKGHVSFRIESKTQPFSLDLTALVLPKFAFPEATVNLNLLTWKV